MSWFINDALPCTPIIKSEFRRLQGTPGSQFKMLGKASPPTSTSSTKFCMHPLLPGPGRAGRKWRGLLSGSLWIDAVIVKQLPPVKFAKSIHTLPGAERERERSTSNILPPLSPTPTSYIESRAVPHPITHRHTRGAKFHLVLYKNPYLAYAELWKADYVLLRHTKGDNNSFSFKYLTTDTSLQKAVSRALFLGSQTSWESVRTQNVLGL